MPARRRLEDGVVYGNIFDGAINSTQFALVYERSDRIRKMFNRFVSIRKIFLEIFQERGNAPEKHSGVPVVIAGSNVFLGFSQLGLLGETPDGENREVPHREP